MKMIKKTLTVFSILFLTGAVGILISAIFGIDAFHGIIRNILITLAILSVMCIFTNTAISYSEKNKLASIICITLITLSGILAIALFWIGLNVSNILNKVTSILAIISILINIIISTRINIGKRFIIIQVVTYLLIIAIDVILTLQVLGIDIFTKSLIPQSFGVLCLVTFLLLCTLLIINKKETVKPINTNPENEKDMVTITRLEYETMKEQITELRKLNAELMNSINPDYK